MTRRVALLVALVAGWSVPAAAQDLDAPAWGRVLRDALAVALPFPEATDEGTPLDGSSDPTWVVRWPADADTIVEVVANPLNARNRERALRAEQEIQRAAMDSQRTSQGDYERALDDFRRTGQVRSEVREITLRDDGVAGERYDAESQLTIRVETHRGRVTRTLGTALDPDLVPPAGPDAPAVVRVSAHEYGTPLRYCAEQAWLAFGATPTVARESADEVTLDMATSSDEAAWVLVRVEGNAALVARVLAEARWTAVAAAVPSP